LFARAAGKGEKAWQRPRVVAQMNAPMKLRVVDYDLRQVAVRLRLPFRYGITTMREMPYLLVGLAVEVEGRPAAGVAADCLPAKWFTKDPARPVPEEIEEMLRVIRHAAETARGMTGPSAFALWRELHARQAAWAADAGLPPLLAHFGTSLVERAVIEAVCRHVGKPFATVLHSGGLDVRLGEIHPELSGSAPADWLPARPLPSIFARHTIGLADPLTEADIPPAERLNDGLPQSLERSIARYGLKHFKIKITGQPAADRERLRRIAEVLSRGCAGDVACSLDGNEAFHSVEEFRAYWNGMSGEAALRPLLSRLLFVEQPLHRSVALAPEVGRAWSQWPEAPPVIIDESDGELESAAQALALGYAGTSHKNCKGVFKGVANRCLLAHRQRAQPTSRFIMSGEDLCGIGPVAVLQDLAVQAALGNESVERNGHHYVAGLSAFPPAIGEAMLAAHGDLYGRSPAGWPTLRIVRGRIELGSVNAAPLGVGPLLDLTSLPAPGGSA
jgi:hypothetical protein